jgi:lipopolysaccharide transport system permease protein
VTIVTMQAELANDLVPQEASTPITGEATLPTTIICPQRGWQLVNVQELWQFRELLYFLAWRDVKVRYKQTVLGAAWAVLQPLMMMVVFTIFFGRMAGVPSGGIPYPLFAYAGLLPWMFFATAVTAAGNSVVQSERLITKVYFPRLTIPLATVAAAVVDFLIAFGLLLVLMLWYGINPGVSLFLAPLIFSLIVLAALGAGTLLGALNVAYRDFRYVIPFLVQLGMFATPTVYMEPKAGGGGFQMILAFNPMTPLIASFRAAVLGGQMPWGSLGLAAFLVAGGAFLGCLYFRKVEDGFADVI